MKTSETVDMTGFAAILKKHKQTPLLNFAKICVNWGNGLLSYPFLRFHSPWGAYGSLSVSICRSTVILTGLFIMTRLAQRLPVVFIPHQLFITTMWSTTVAFMYLPSALHFSHSGCFLKNIFLFLCHFESYITNQACDKEGTHKLSFTYRERKYHTPNM